MKSYDQALNEIYQKAQARAEQIKKRNKIVLAILPVFCVIALTIAMIFLATPPATSDPGSDPVAPPNDSLQTENPKDDPDKEEVVQPPEKNPDEDIKNENNEGTDVPPNESGDDPNQNDPNQGDPNQGDPNQDDPNQNDPNQNDPNQNNPDSNNPNQDDPNHGNTDKDDPLPPVVEYLEVAPGKFIYRGGGTMGVGGNNGNVTYALKGLEELGLINEFPKTQKVVYEELKGTRVYHMLGKDVVIEYIFSYECVGEVGDEVKKYENVHVYRGEGNSSYQFSAVTGQLVRYYNPQGEDNADGETDPEIVHKRFIESQLGEGILDSYERHFTANSRGYDYTFSKKIAGFNTTERISVGINSHGELTFYLIQHLGAYDQYIDNVSIEDIAYTVDMVLGALYWAGVKTGGYYGTSFVLDANGVLYVAVCCYNRTFYSEVLDAGLPDIEYIEVAPGKYLYVGGGDEEGVGNSNADVTYAIKGSEELGLIDGFPQTQKVVHEELKGTRVFNMLGKDVLLEYICSYECVDEVGDEVKKYKNVHVYEDEENSIYYFSAVTDLMVYYDKNPFRAHEDSLIDTDIICKMIVESQLGEGILDSYEKHLDYDGSYYEYSFYKKIAGFDTMERIYVVVSDHKELQTYRIEYVGAYDDYLDTVTWEDITYTTEMVMRALWQAGINVGKCEETNLVLDANGDLYVAVFCEKGGIYYSELLDEDDAWWNNPPSSPEEEEGEPPSIPDEETQD